MSDYQNIKRASWVSGVMLGATIFVCYALISSLISNPFTEITYFGARDPEIFNRSMRGMFTGHFLGPDIWTIISIISVFLYTYMYRSNVKHFASVSGQHPNKGLVLLCCFNGFISFASLVAFLIFQEVLFAFTWVGMIFGAVCSVSLFRKIVTPPRINQDIGSDGNKSRLRNVAAPDWAIENARKLAEKQE